MASKKQIKISTEAQVPELLREYAEIQSRIDNDRNRMWEIEEQLRDLNPGTYNGYGNDSVKVSSYTRLNADAALNMLSPRSQARVMVLRPDARLIRKHFPGVARRATVEYDNRLSINVSERHLVAVD